MTNVVPNKALLRRRDVLETLGVSSKTLARMVKNGVVKPVYLEHDEKGEALGRAYYTRDSIVAFLEGVGV